MPEHFMEENRGSATGEKRGTCIGFDQRRSYESFEFLAEDLSFGEHSLVVGSVRRIRPVKIIITVDVHPIGRFALDKQFQPVMNLAELQARPFAVGLILIFSKRAECDD